MNFLSKSDRGLSCGAFVDVVTSGPTTGFSLEVSSLLFLVVCTDQTTQRKKLWRTAQRLPDGRGGSVAIVGTVEQSQGQASKGKAALAVSGATD